VQQNCETLGGPANHLEQGGGALCGNVMQTPYLYEGGPLHAPSYVFVRCATGLSDVELLGALGVSVLVHPDPEMNHDPHLIKVVDDGAWTHVMGDYGYRLWGRIYDDPEGTIGRLSERHDVFTCAIGDCDRSYDFALHQHGAPIRRRVVSSPNFSNRRVVTNWGARLPGENPWVRFWRDGLEIGLPIARAMGVDLDHRPRTVRTYIDGS
jgi:hypothetical protein